jgi:hypothetical protein
LSALLQAALRMIAEHLVSMAIRYVGVLARRALVA